MEDSKTVTCRRTPFSFFQRSSLHPIVIIVLFYQIFYYHFLPSTGWWRGYALLLVGVKPPEVTEHIQDLELKGFAREITVAPDL